MELTKHLQVVCQQFLAHEFIVISEPFGSGLINSTFKVIAKSNGTIDEFILQKINTRIFKNPIALMDNISKVADHLLSKKYPLEILKPTTTLQGASLYVDSNKEAWRMFPFVNNTITFDSVATNKQALETALSFGQYLSYLLDFDPSQLEMTIPNFHDTRMRFEDFQQVIKLDPSNRVGDTKKEIADLLSLEQLIQKAEKLDLPIRVVHNDTKINNLLLDAKTLKAKCIVDLDTLMPGKLMDDFGDLVRTSVSPVDENESDICKVTIRLDIFRNLTIGFLHHLKDKIEPVEIESLLLGAMLITYEQAIRFLGDYLAGDKYYKTDYSNHNLVRAKNQIALVQALLREEETLNKIIKENL